MDSAFVAFGHGYETGSRGRCIAFDGFEVIANPLGGFDEASREARHFPRADGRPGVTYSSHAIKLAKRERALTSDRDLFILMHHGGGREVLRVPTIYDSGALEAHIRELPERLQYALLYTIWQTAANARHEAQRQTQHEWALAYQDGRIRKRRKGGRVRVHIESEFERDLRKGTARPERIAIDVATGSVTPA